MCICVKIIYIYTHLCGVGGQNCGSCLVTLDIKSWRPKFKRKPQFEDSIPTTLNYDKISVSISSSVFWSICFPDIPLYTPKYSYITAHIRIDAYMYVYRYTYVSRISLYTLMDPAILLILEILHDLRIL